MAGAAAQATAAAAQAVTVSSSAWATRSQTRLARVAQLAARATSALAEALRAAHTESTSPGRPHGLSGSGSVVLDAGIDELMPNFTPTSSLVLESKVNGSTSRLKVNSEIGRTISIAAVTTATQNDDGNVANDNNNDNNDNNDDDFVLPQFPSVTLQGIRSGTTSRPDQQPKWREGRDILLLQRVFSEVSDTGNHSDGKVCKKELLDALTNDFAVQTFIAENPYNLFQPLFLRSMTFTPRENATKFEIAPPTTNNIDRIVQWNDILTHIEKLGGTSVSAKGTTEDTGDSYDPRFAFDGKRQRSQAEREQHEQEKEQRRVDKEQAEIDRRRRQEQAEKNNRLEMFSRSSLDVMGGGSGGEEGVRGGGGGGGGEAEQQQLMQQSLRRRSEERALTQRMSSGMSRSSYENMDDIHVPVSYAGTFGEDSTFHNSVLSTDLDHELSWQYRGGDGRTFNQPETDQEARARYEREESEFRKKRAEVEADLSVARTALAVRNLEAAQHIETVGRELNKRLKNGKSKSHRLLSVRADAAAEIARVSSDAELVREKVQAHINGVDEMLRMRQNSKNQRRHEEAKKISNNILRDQHPEDDDDDDDGENQEDMRLVRRVEGTDGVMRIPGEQGSRRGRGRGKEKKIFVDSSDPEMRMLFADYEHGTKVREKIMQVRTVHTHISEEEAFLALVECGSDVDRAIGKLTDVRFFRDLRAVSNVTKSSRPNAFAHATATAMQKGSERNWGGAGEGSLGDGGGSGGAAGEREEADGRTTNSGAAALVSTYDNWVEYRETREREEDGKEKGKGPKRVPLEAGGRRSGKGSSKGGLHSGQITDNARELGSALAMSSPYLSAPFTRAKPSKEERRRKKEKKKGSMANSFPAHIEGALAADAKLKKFGGARKRMHQNRGKKITMKKMSGGIGAAGGSGARAAAAVSFFFLIYFSFFCFLVSNFCFGRGNFF